MSVNTAAVRRPELITELSKEFGAQAVVLAIDARRNADGGWNVFTNGGRVDEGIDAVEWAARGEALGAGEILLTSMDTDGVQTGFDCELTRAVSRATHIPVIASGGAGKPEDFVDVLTEGEADAALAASIFHYGTYTVDDLKANLDRARHPGEENRRMIIPCIDLMDGKVVQLVQGREKALEGAPPLEMLERFAAFPEIQVIDLDAAIGKGANDAIVETARRAGPHAASAAACARRSAPRTLMRAGRAPGDRRHGGVHRRRRQPRSCSTRSPPPSAARRITDRARFQGRPHRRQGLARVARPHRRRGDRANSSPTAAASSAPTSTRKA